MDTEFSNKYVFYTASYARWLSGCKLASRNGSVSAAAVSNEVGSILGLLRAQLHGAGHGGDVTWRRVARRVIW
jgi:hypothetical protein